MMIKTDQWSTIKINIRKVDLFTKTTLFLWKIRDHKSNGISIVCKIKTLRIILFTDETKKARKTFVKIKS